MKQKNSSLCANLNIFETNLFAQFLIERHICFHVREIYFHRETYVFSTFIIFINVENTSISHLYLCVRHSIRTKKWDKSETTNFVHLELNILCPMRNHETLNQSSFCNHSANFFNKIINILFHQKIYR